MGRAVAWVFGCENRMAAGLSYGLVRDYVLYRTWQSARNLVFVCLVAVLSELRSLAASKSFAFLAALLFCRYLRLVFFG